MKEAAQQFVQQHSTALDGVSIAAVLGALAGILPPVAALLAIVYHVYGIYLRRLEVKKMKGQK